MTTVEMPAITAMTIPAIEPVLRLTSPRPVCGELVSVASEVDMDVRASVELAGVAVAGMVCVEELLLVELLVLVNVNANAESKVCMATEE